MKNKPLLATVHTETSNGYKTLSFDLFFRRGWSGADRLATVKWQSGGGPVGWYGPSVQVDVDANNAPMFLAFLARLVTKNPLSKNPGQWFADTGADLCVYDNRFSEFVAIRDVKPSEHRRWMARKADETCAVAVVCQEYRAESELTKEFARCIAEYGREYEASFVEWIGRGKPVEECTGKYWEAPQLLNWEDAMRPLGEPVAETETANA